MPPPCSHNMPARRSVRNGNPGDGGFRRISVGNRRVRLRAVLKSLIPCWRGTAETSGITICPMSSLLPALRTAACVLLLSVHARADVVKLVVEQRQPLPNQTQPYEKLTGRFYGELDPSHPLNAIITDLELAPRNARGMVEYSATFTILKPADMSRATGVLVYQVPNRGQATIGGGGYYADFRANGYVLVSSGWQADIPAGAGVETMVTPIAKNPDGSSITGPVMARFLDMPAGVDDLADHSRPRDRHGHAGEPRHVEGHADTAHLRRRQPRADRRLGLGVCRLHADALSGTSRPGEAVSQERFRSRFSLRIDLHREGSACARHRLRRDARSASPSSGKAAPQSARSERTARRRAGFLAVGQLPSQFPDLGFNQDERGQRVFDGMNANIAARQLSMNIRFAAPSGAAEMFEPGSEGMLWWDDYTDTARGRASSSLLARCRASEMCPKIVETFGSAEFYSLRMSPDLVGTRADRDIPLPPKVRRTIWLASARRRCRRILVEATPDACCLLATNPNSSAEANRALMKALVDWVVSDAPPPPSRYPRLDRGDLVPPTRSGDRLPPHSRPAAP